MYEIAARCSRIKNESMDGKQEKPDGKKQGDKIEMDKMEIKKEMEKEKWIKRR